MELLGFSGRVEVFVIRWRRENCHGGFIRSILPAGLAGQVFKSEFFLRLLSLL